MDDQPARAADAPTIECFLRDVLSNRCNRAILERWQRLALPDGWLVAGCLFQTVWNLRSGAPAEARIKDYDLFYFDGADLGEAAERRVHARVQEVLGDLGVAVEVKNQARVHLWYREHFGHPYPRLDSVREGIDRFLIPATCVGLRPCDAGWELYAPHGLSLMYEGVLAPNPLTDHRPLFEAKARSYRSRWPWLRIAGDGGVQCKRNATEAAALAASATPAPTTVTVRHMDRVGGHCGCSSSSTAGGGTLP